jgi:hypothetical protein
MLMPIIAAIGSFWVSERILKPKATALFILSCLAVYDVFISPPIPILRGGSASSHRGDEIMEEMMDITNTAATTTTRTDDGDGGSAKTANDNVSNNYYYKLYNQQEEDDLATSLRCYRGPLLLAVALFCAAYSLRVWRRGGCACDELLFLPGTPHEHAIIVARGSSSGGKKNSSGTTTTGGDGDGSDDRRSQNEDIVELEMTPPLNNSTSNNIIEPQQQQQQQTTKQRSSSKTILFRKSQSSPSVHESFFNSSSQIIETSLSEGDAAAGGGGGGTERQSLITTNHDDDDDHIELSHPSNSSPSLQRATVSSSTKTSSSSLIATDDSSPMGYIRERAWSGLNMLVVTENFGVPSLPELLENNHDDDRHDDDHDDNINTNNTTGSGLSIATGGDKDDGTTRRKTSLTNNNNNSNNKERYDVDYAPSGPSVLGAALDLTLPVLFNFHMFVVLMKDHYKKEAAEAGILMSSSLSAVEDEISSSGVAAAVNSSDDAFGGGALQLFTPPEIPPKVLPLIFLSGVLVRTQFPRRQRVRFYKTILQGTILAPFKPVRFRDAFVGDIVTSLVRPIVDVVFTATYYGAAMYGFFSRKYDLNETGYIVSESSLLHGIVLPFVAILPLWMRFLQTLRQAYDTGKRWPYLGNAFKYLTAGLVVLYGMTHAAGERGTMWIISFTAATLYQILWDSCIDWELLVVVRNDAREMKDSYSSLNVSSLLSWWRCPTFISSLNPRFFPTTLLMYVVQPFRRHIGQPIRRLWELMPKRFDQIRLRPRRLFDDDKFYWRALFVNAALRFCWMMGFIPAYRVSIMDGSTQETFADKFNGWSFVILGALEIFRRSIWGIIKVELETIKLTTGGDNDLAMASTADEYLREGKWNAWRRNGVPAANDNVEEQEEEDGEDSQIIWLNPAGEKQHRSPGSRRTESCIFKNQSGNQTHRWLGMTVGSNFIRAAYKVELLLWPVVFLVLSYKVILIE